MFKKIYPIILLSFVNIIGLSILIPVLPSVVANYIPEATFAENTESVRAIVYGFLLATYPFAQFIAAPYLGSLSDKYGRRPLLLLSQAGTLLSWVVFGLAYFLPQDHYIGGFALPLIVIFLTRVIDGLTGGNISVAQAWVSDATTHEEKTKAFGLLGATFGFGFMIGPALGGSSASTSIGYLGTVIAALAISIVTFIIMFAKLPESLAPEDRSDHPIHLLKEINVFRKFALFKDTPSIVSLLKVRTAFSLTFAAFTTLITLVLQQDFQLEPAGIGFVMTAIGIFSIINQGIITPRIAEKYSDITTFYLGLLISSLAIMCIPIIPPITSNIAAFIANSYFINLGLCFSLPTFKSILVKQVEKNKQGMATGIDESLRAFGNSISPIFAGALYGLIQNWSFIIIAAIVLIPGAAAYWGYRTKK